MKTLKPFNTILSLMCFCFMLVLSGCQMGVEERVPAPHPPTKRVPKTTDYKVALLLPLSGAHAELGDSLRQAAEMSLFDRPQVPLQLIPLDTKGTSSGAREAVLIAKSRGADVILGPVFSPEAKSVKKTLASFSGPVISYSTDVTLAEPHFFIFGFDVIQQIEEVMRYALSKDIRSVVAIIPTGAYGKLIENGLNSLSRLRHMEVEKILSYTTSPTPSAEQFAPLAGQLAGLTPQALFIPEGGKTLITLLSSLESEGVDLSRYQLLGTGQWDQEGILHAKESQGGWFANAPLEDRMRFEQRYHEVYGKPPHRLASLAYDSVSVIATLVQRYPENPFSLDFLTQKQGFYGVDGLFRFLPNGDTERSLAIFKIISEDLQLLRPSARKF